MPNNNPDTLTILLLGSPRILLNGQPLTFRSNKAVALLGYLSLSGRLHDRAELALLLWPESDNKRARGALRYTLSLLRKELGADFLNVNRHYIGLNPEANWEGDVVKMRHLLAPALKPETDLTAAQVAEVEQGVALYRADFLHGFTLRDSDNFNEWAIRQTEALRRDLATALKQLLAYHQRRQHWDAALSYGHRWLNMDPLHEAAHGQLLEIYAAAGQWTAFQDQYQSLVDLLEEELGAPPQPETETLYRQLRRRRETAAVAPTPLAGLSRDQRSQRVLIEKVRRFWINGLLVPLRDEERFMRLRLQFNNAAIEHPWADVADMIDVADNPAVTSIGQAFRAADHALLILGASGAGKTISLIELADTLLTAAAADETQPIPVILNLSAWAGREMTIAAWAEEEMVVQYQIPRRLGRAWLAQDRLLLLLDGLDEIPPAGRADCITAINHFRQRHGLADLVVCCRQEAYEMVIRAGSLRLQLNGAVVVRPLTTAQIRNTVRPALAEAIFQDETLLEMARSPLTLSMLRLAFNGNNGNNGNNGINGNNNGNGGAKGAMTAPLTPHHL